MPYSLREALAALRRAPLLVVLSVLAIALSLFVVGLFGLAAYNIRHALDRIEERVEIVAYLRDGVVDVQLQQLQHEVRSLPEVADVRYVSKTEALAAAVRDLEEFREIYTELEVNPLPASLEISLLPGQRTPEAVERVVQTVSVLPGVDDVRYGREWLDKIVALRRIAGGAAGILGSAFALTAAIIIAAAIRIAVFARRDEISIMRLVGATNAFIRRPFLLEGLFTGLLGGMFAVTLTFGAFAVVDALLFRVVWLPVPWALAGVALGAALGFASSAIAVRRHLQAI